MIVVLGLKRRDQRDQRDQPNYLQEVYNPLRMGGHSKIIFETLDTLISRSKEIYFLWKYSEFVDFV